jgi:hypothetical protein
MLWFLIVVLVLLIPILSIVLDSQVGRALAARLERREIGPAGDLLADRLAYLEGEVERLSGEVRRLEEEGRFVQELLEKRGPERPVLREGERTD